MAANPNSGGYSRRGQPYKYLKCKASNLGGGYSRRGQPFHGIVIIPATTTIVKDIMKSGMVIPFNR